LAGSLLSSLRAPFAESVEEIGRLRNRELCMGPLSGINIVELAAIGPAPMAAMLLADMGARVLRICRIDDSGPGLRKPPQFDLVMRGRLSVAVDLKKPEGVELVLRLLDRAEGLIEGFRPGTTERLGLGPDVALARNPRLVYGRMTGFGQDGPLARAAGHDLNYIALTGALDAIGRSGGKPVAPMNLLGDYAGGSLYLAFGMVCAMLEARTSQKGQVVDAAIVDGTASLMTMIYGLREAGLHSRPRGENLLDGGAAIYDVYLCRDGRYISIAPIETKFRHILFQRLGIDLTDDEGANLSSRLEALFATRTRDEWVTLLEGSDACFAPVLSMAEAPFHPHNLARRTFVDIAGVIQPGPAPRFSRSSPDLPSAPEKAGASGRQALGEWGLDDAQINVLLKAGAIKIPHEVN
jgi:alpha-methylacyl-CoA racemase